VTLLVGDWLRGVMLAVGCLPERLMPVVGGLPARVG